MLKNLSIALGVMATTCVVTVNTELSAAAIPSNLSNSAQWKTELEELEELKNLEIILYSAAEEEGFGDFGQIQVTNAPLEKQTVVTGAPPPPSSAEVAAARRCLLSEVLAGQISFFDFFRLMRQYRSGLINTVGCHGAYILQVESREFDAK